jgi:hypothetical protein
VEDVAMTEQETAATDSDKDVSFFEAQIRRLSPPQTDKDAQLLELYEQLLEKHVQAGGSDSDFVA